MSLKKGSWRKTWEEVCGGKSGNECDQLSKLRFFSTTEELFFCSGFLGQMENHRGFLSLSIKFFFLVPRNKFLPSSFKTIIFSFFKKSAIKNLIN